LHLPWILFQGAGAGFTARLSGGAGYSIQRIGNHSEWLRRFADRLRHIPDDHRQHSVLAILAYVDHPHPAYPPVVRNERFVAALRTLPSGPAVPHLDEGLIHKYLDDMRRVGLVRWCVTVGVS
jgi:hypothetical protein